MDTPTLYVFNISHYCEKARWALESSGIEHRVQHTMAGAHRALAKRLGARRGSLPFLHVGSEVVCGSSAIVDWCESHCRAFGGQEAAPWQQGDDREARAIEKRLDEVSGVHVRRFFYSVALLSVPLEVRPLFTHGLPLWQRAALTLGWKRVVGIMCKTMDLGPGQALESRAILEKELDWLDGLLADGRPYLCGDHWSRADLAAASLIGPLVEPPEHPMVGRIRLPSLVADTAAQWARRPIMQHLRGVYARHRHPCAKPSA